MGIEAIPDELAWTLDYTNFEPVRAGGRASVEGGKGGGREGKREIKGIQAKRRDWKNAGK